MYMTELGFDKVREMQRRERKETSLGELKEDFYPSLAGFIKEASQDYNKNPSTEKLRENENALKLARDMFDQREQKILLKALRAARGAKGKEENMTPEEKKMFDSLVKSLKEHREFFEGLLIGKQSQTPKTLLNKNEHKIVLVRALKEIPRFVGSDASEHGPFKQDSVVKLPEKEAELLLKRSLVEKM